MHLAPTRNLFAGSYTLLWKIIQQDSLKLLALVIKWQNVVLLRIGPTGITLARHVRYAETTGPIQFFPEHSQYKFFGILNRERRIESATLKLICFYFRIVYIVHPDEKWKNLMMWLLEFPFPSWMNNMDDDKKKKKKSY